MSDEYEYWRNALQGRFGPIVETEPQPGRYRFRAASVHGVAFWKPLAIWPDDGGVIWVRAGDGDAIRGEDAGKLWIACAKHPISEDEYEIATATGKWPSDPPVAVATLSTETTPNGSNASENNAIAGPGHNSGDPASFEAMRAALEGDISDARAHFRRSPIKTKADADLAENWRQRIYAAGKTLDEKRKAERKPHDDAIAEIQTRYNPVLDAARAYAKQGGELDLLAQAWVKAEQARLRKEAEEKARAEFERQRAEAEAARKRAEEERAAKLRDDPVAALTDPEPELPPVPQAPSPILDAPKVMIGTGATRRGAQAERHTATITDAKALAAHLVEQKHPDLLECLQKIANAAARSRARATMPGVRMSWETGRAA